MRRGRLLLALGGVALIGLAGFEATMRPSAAERWQLLALLAGMGGITAAAALVLPRWARATTSLRRTAVVLSLTAAVIVTGAVAAAGGLMFLSSHDLTLLFVVLAAGMLAGAVFALAVARPWTEDVVRIGETAGRIADGTFSARTGVERRDELGRLGAAIDAMAARLAEAERLRRAADEERRRFLAAVGHDLRSPLASLQAAIEALEDGIAPDPPRYLRAMERDVAALSRLVDNLFLLAKIEAGGLELVNERVDVSEVADEAIEVMRPVADGRQVDVRLVTRGRVVVEGSPEALSRAIRNLVDNAIRHAPARSEVLVTVANGDGAEVRVTDQGPGFDPEFVAEAFEDFTRFDPARSRDTGGAGLGLAIARGFIEALGGRIWAEPGPGGTVAFRIPAQAST